MKKIVLATANVNKVAEIKKILGNDFDIVTMAEMGIDIDIVENGQTFEDNALIKVRTLKGLIKDSNAIIIGDDSGLAVDALAGEPGVYSARYAGENVTYRDNNIKLLKELEAIPDQKRGAKFITVVAILYPDGHEDLCKGCVRGKIARALIGDKGFGYDPLFIHEKSGRSYGQMSEEEKNAISHRALALEKVKDRLLKK